MTEEEKEEARDIAELSQALAKQIIPILAGKGQHAQSAALMDLVAIWLAGNMAFKEDGSFDREQTDKLRNDIFKTWTKGVFSLVPVNEAMMLEDVREDAH